MLLLHQYLAYKLRASAATVMPLIRPRAGASPTWLQRPQVNCVVRQTCSFLDTSAYDQLLHLFCYHVQEVANDMLTEQSPKRLYTVRGKLYELLGNCIPPELILRTLLVELLKKLDDELKVEVTKQAAFYEHRLQEGQKPIFHLEAFIAKFMSAYKTWMIQNFG